MAYEKQTWVDLVTPLDAAHMNHIEDGIAALVGIESIAQTTTSTSDGGTNVITATLSNGTTAKFNIKNGSKGSTGSKGDTGATGAAGVGIKTVTQTTTSNADGGENVITFTKTDGSTSTITVKNGSKGSKGDAGAAGAAGYTPVKFVDYYTPADLESIVQQVIAALGTPVYGTIDENNHITLSGHLVDGTYTLSFEDTDGFTSEFCTIEKGGITNLADPTSADWIANSRLNSSGAVVATSYSETYQGAVTNFIPCKAGDVIRVKGLDISSYYANAQGTTGRATAFFFAENKSTIIAKNVPGDGNGWVYADGVWSYTVGTSLTAVSGSNSDIRLARLTGIYYSGYTKNDVIITVNQEIP